jgi:hypothetical protein
VFFACVTFVPLAHAEESQKKTVTAIASVDRTTVAIGDTITYSVRVSSPKETVIEFPNFAGDLGGFVIKDFGEKTKESFWRDTKTITKWFLLDTYVSGSYEIPQMLIRYKKDGDDLDEECLTDAIEVTVESVLAMDDGRSEIYEIKEPIMYPSKLWLYVWIAIGILFLGGGAFLVYALSRKKNNEPIIPPKPAHDIAYAALRELKLKKYIDQGFIKDFYCELSLIIRHYIENRFDIRAPEMTTEEFLETVRASSTLTNAQKELLRNFLEQSDMVKFAKYGPLPEEIQKSFEAAHHFVDQTRCGAVPENKETYEL